MEIIHYASVVNIAVATISAEIAELNGVEAYVFQTYHGKLQVYLRSENPIDIGRIKKKLIEQIGAWLENCEPYSEAFFLEIEWMKGHKITREQIAPNIWVIQKLRTHTCWDRECAWPTKPTIQSKTVSFYSYKGGVGKTTTLLMTALSLARMGKRIIIVDLNLEAPGVETFFPKKLSSKYGVLDFLTEYNVYADGVDLGAPDRFRIDEYVYPVSDICKTTAEGGELYIVPACGSVARESPELYGEYLMRADPSQPDMMTEFSISTMLEKLDDFLSPDMIFIDTGAGLTQISGMLLAGYSDLGLLFFYGNRQHTEGMQMVLPNIKRSKTPFLMINAMAPVDGTVAEIERKYYIEGAFAALSTCDDRYANGDIAIDDESAEHVPIDITYHPALEIINNKDQLLWAYDRQKPKYEKLASRILDVLSQEGDS